ncbi:unnamed protein product, partial [Prorocentrum cordatum]
MGPGGPGGGNGTRAICPRKRSGILPGFANLTHPEVYRADELQKYLDSPTYGYGTQPRFFAAVVFGSVGGQGEPGAPGHWSYSIRLNVSMGTTPYTGVPKTRPLQLGLLMNEANTYMNKGHVALQLLFDRYIIGSRDGDANATALLHANRMHLVDADHHDGSLVEKLAEPLRWAPQSIETVPMPVSGVVIDGFYKLVSIVFPLIFIIGFLYTQKKVVNELITEKETKVRESLKIMGVSSAKIIASWYVTYGRIFSVLCMVFAVVAGIEIFPLSSGTVIFVFFWLWCMSFLSFGWFMHCFFNKSRTGGIVTMVVMMLQWVVYGSQKRNGQEPSAAVLLLMLPFPNAALSAGLDMLAKFEAAKVGATWDKLDWPVDNSTMATVLGAMAASIVFWTLLGWYLDQVLPKEYGTRLPPHFPLLASYWLDRPSGPGLHAASEGRAVGPEAPPALCAGRDTVEAVPEAVRARSRASGTLVQTVGLRKEFRTSGGPKVAVSGLDLTMYDGQILALLGHNGAGKSTTINMLTGMVAPSRGEAFVAGHSILTDMRDIRRVIGVCPQHDVLWLELTVLEHLRVYARLRGVSASEVVASSEDMLTQVGLTEKAMTRAGSLSGGQKRKLSLCLALMGQPRATFLDEPTSGMDPFSRRSTWNLIRGSREGRVTVLTTHFMDEADILGDRIAIMADGDLQCCGSSLFLKRRFGAGYRITCAKKIGTE